MTDHHGPGWPAAFAAEWVEAWNTHDLDRILSHYAPDVVVTSPAAARLVPGSAGVVRGLDDLRDYWAQGLRSLPDLHFRLESALATVDGLTVLYTNERGQRVAETMLWSTATGRIDRVIAAYE